MPEIEYKSEHESARIIERLEYLCRRMYGDYWLWFMYRRGERPPRDLKPLLNNYEIEELEISLGLINETEGAADGR